VKRPDTDAASSQLPLRSQAPSVAPAQGQLDGALHQALFRVICEGVAALSLNDARVQSRGRPRRGEDVGVDIRDLARVREEEIGVPVSGATRTIRPPGSL